MYIFMGGVNSHIQSLSNTDYFEICASMPKAHPYFFLGNCQFYSGNSRKLSEIPNGSGISVTKSVLIAYYKLRHYRSGYNFMHVKC